ncbi:MAG: DUF4157 domain-containing protein, partial [Heliobacteriaceae bacterium]|nr:DUF4157 domain-containing protein [Heliobacteriaceae bacterium]
MMMKAYTSRKKAESTDKTIQTGRNQESMGNQAVLKMLAAAESFNPNRGTELTLPEELKRRMENRFGVSLSGIQLRESSQVSSLGTRAVAQGDTISFAPGAYDPTTRTGREIIGHEMAHVVQQANGGVNADIAGTNISLDQGLEHAADHEGSMAVMDTGSLMEGQQPLAVLPAVTAANAPMQGNGWGLGGMW